MCTKIKPAFDEAFDEADEDDPDAVLDDEVSAVDEPESSSLDSSSLESYFLTGFLGLGSSSQLTQPGGVVGEVALVVVLSVCWRRSSRGFSRPLAAKSSQVPPPPLAPAPPLTGPPVQVRVIQLIDFLVNDLKILLK